MTEIKTGKQINANPPYCRCRCEYDDHTWLPLEIYAESTTFDEGGCGCGCGFTNQFSVDVFAIY